MLSFFFRVCAFCKNQCTDLCKGTPEESRTSELYNLLHCLYPKVFSSLDAFMDRYSEMVEEWGHFREIGGKNLDELSEVLRSCMFRISKKEALPNLPPKYRYQVFFECDVEGKKEMEKMAIIRSQLQQIVPKNQIEAARVAQKRKTHHQNTCTLGGELKARVAKSG